MMHGNRNPTGTDTDIKASHLPRRSGPERFPIPRSVVYPEAGFPTRPGKTNTTVNKTTRYIADDIKVGRTDLSEWVFPSGEGTPLDLHNVAKREFPKCLQRARLRRIRFHEHNLRHTMASLLIQNGAPLAYAKDQLGHSSRKITVDIYGHLVPGVNRQEMNRLPSLNSVQSTDLKMKGK